MRFVGQLCLLGAFVGTGYAAFACVLGWRNGGPLIRRSGAIAAIASGLLLTVAMGVLLNGLLGNDYRFDYVASYSNRLLPWYYAFSALWVGQAGSLLLWAWLSALLSLAFRYLPSRQQSSLREPAFGVLMGFCCFLVATMVFAADPMAPSLGTPQDGVGLSPLLQHPSMLIHPPIVFLAYSAWAIPFALAITALATGQLGAGWTWEARPWALFAWLVLGAGILLGAQWAYEELGWGGYWGWDPVENGSLIPWLIGTAAIHTMMAWRRRGVLKKSACVLIIATFGMCNFATFLTRSGIFSSLHAFSQSPIGWLFLGLMIVMGAAGCTLIVRQRTKLVPERSIPSLWCRESMIVVNTLALVSLAVVTCVGTLSAAISDAIVGRQIVLGVAFYNNALIPTGFLLLAATACAPLLRWGGTPTSLQKRMLSLSAGAGVIAVSVAFLTGIRSLVGISVIGLIAFGLAAFATSLIVDTRSNPSASLLSGFARTLSARRRLYAGFVVHLGFFCLALGITASSLGTQQREVVLQEGESLNWAGHRVRLVQINQRELPDKLIAEARLEVSKGTASPRTLTPAQHFHILQQEWTSEVAIQSTWTGDFYTILHGRDDDGSVRLTFIHNPLVGWIWAGGWIMGLGSVAALWGFKRHPRQAGSIGRKMDVLKRHSRVAGKLRSAAVWLAALASASDGLQGTHNLHSVVDVSPLAMVADSL